MNVSLICVAKSAKGQQQLRQRFNAAVKYIEDYYPANNASVKHIGNTIVYNSESLGKTWKVPCTHESNNGFYSLSQPAIPVAKRTSETRYWNDLTDIVERGRLKELLPNHFGARVDNGGNTLVWSDYWGLGRCYAVEGDIIAFSNHIGSLAFFLDGPLEIDRQAVGKYAGSSFYFGEETPYKQVRKLPPASVVKIIGGRLSTSTYEDYENLFRKTSNAPNFDKTADELSTIANNISALAEMVPVASLSGGRDSRMTAAVMLSAGLPLTIKTINTWPEETELASRLIKLFRDKNPAAEVEHQIVQPQPTKVTQSLHHRLEKAFLMWDGDALQNRVNGNLTFPREKNRLNISGASGETMHAAYWAGAGQMERFESTPDFLQKRLPALLGITRLSTESQTAVVEEAEQLYSVIHNAGWKDDVRGLDVLYFIGKNSRWPPQTLNAHSPIILAAPSFVRSSFNLTKKEKLEKHMVPELLKRTIPEWADVPTFRATGNKAQDVFRHGTATFQTDPDGFFDLISRKEFWPQFLDEDKMDENLEKVRSGTQIPADVTWLNKAIWLEYLEIHTTSLNRRVAQAIASEQ